MLIAVVAMSILHVVVLRWVNPTLTPLMVSRVIEAQREGTPFVLKRQWVSLDEISKEMPRAVIASEDNLFRKHRGFSMDAIENAIEERMEKGEWRHGGSTISQQTAKNVFTFGSTRSFVRKGVEAYYTCLIELIWGKRRIMEVYLNIAEMGDGIFGAEAAAKEFFHKPAAQLTRQEAALIAVCFPNPRKMHVDRPSSYVLKRRVKIVDLMGKIGYLGDLDAEMK